MNKIESFSGEYRWLSNFFPSIVQLHGVYYPTVENAYQAAKALPGETDKYRACSPGLAKRLGRMEPLPDTWPKDRLFVMSDLIQQKFAPGLILAKFLLDTGDCEIIEGNNWGDTFWGQCDGKGENTLGKLIMNHRSYLKRVPKGNWKVLL